MLLPMYLIFSKMRNEDHYCHNAILLSPCGTHFHANWMIRLFGQICVNVIPYFANGVGVPNAIMQLGQKLLCDIGSLPAAHDLVTYFASQTVGGPAHGKDVYLLKKAELVKSVLRFGWSNMMAA